MYATRTPTGADLDAIVELTYAAELVYDPQAVRYTADEIRREWDDLVLDRDAWVVVDDNDVVCGYATLTAQTSTGRLYADGYTHPDHDGRGIGSLLLRRLHDRAAEFAAEPAATRLVLVNSVMCGGSAQALLESRGYTLARVHQRMHRELSSALPAVSWPDGITVKPCDGSDADIRRAYECVEDAFTDHYGRARRTFEAWSAFMIYDGFDPSLWTLAEHDGDVVGVSLCRTRNRAGEVDMLGVQRPWRRHGLGEALLRHSFAELRSRGAAGVGLGVDSQSLTGADRLYARVGMAVTSRMGRFEIEQRHGHDLLADQAVL